MEKIIKYKDQEFVTFFDDEDEELVNRYNWYVHNRNGKWYVHTNIWDKESKVYWKNRKHKYFQLHRVIMGVTDSKIMVDHINGNPLDNRKCNLRLCTNAENCRNQKRKSTNIIGYKGVSKVTGLNLYQVRITLNGKTTQIGSSYKTPEEAAKAYDEAAIKYHGEFARLNFPKKELTK